MNITVHLSVGGGGRREDYASLKAGPQVIVGTPGRIYGNLDRNLIRAGNLRCLCLDEADEMLSKGFKDTMFDIFQWMPPEIQVCLFSATMPDDCLQLTNAFMRNPVHILVEREKLSLEGISQYYVDSEQEQWKCNILQDLYECANIQQAIIFCNTKRKVDTLVQQLTAVQFCVSSLHGEMEQMERDLKMKEFRSGSSRILVTTDVLSRGIDVQNVSLVINYDVPLNWETYLHRVGRSGRCGRKGIAINFVNGEDQRDLSNFRGIEKHYGITIDELPADIAGLT